MQLQLNGGAVCTATVSTQVDVKLWVGAKMTPSNHHDGQEAEASR